MKMIGLFFPALISISIKQSRSRKNTWEMPEMFIEYGKYVLVNVLLTTVIITYGLNVSDVTVDALNSFPFFTKYIVIAIMMAVLTPFIEEMLKKYVKVTFAVKTSAENKNRSTMGCMDAKEKNNRKDN